MAYLGVGALLPVAGSREELPQPLHHLAPNLHGFQHVSLGPPLSASAETIWTIETPCQVKTYGPTTRRLNPVIEKPPGSGAREGFEAPTQAPVPVQPARVSHLAARPLRAHHRDERPPRGG